MNKYCIHCGKEIPENGACECPQAQAALASEVPQNFSRPVPQNQPVSQNQPQQPVQPPQPVQPVQSAQPIYGQPYVQQTQQPSTSTPYQQPQQTYGAPQTQFVPGGYQNNDAVKKGIDAVASFYKTVFTEPTKAFKDLKEKNNFVLGFICIAIKAVLLQISFTIFTLIRLMDAFEYASRSTKFLLFGGTLLRSIVFDLLIICAVFVIGKIFSKKIDFLEVVSTFGILALSYAAFTVVTTFLSTFLISYDVGLFLYRIIRGANLGLHFILLYNALKAVFDETEKEFFFISALSFAATIIVSSFL